MADSGNQKLQVDIILNKIGSGAQVSADELDALRKATGKASDATKEHGEKVLGLNLGLGEQRRAVGELRNELPLLTEAWTAFTNPVIFGVTAIIGLFAKAKEALGEWNKELDDMAARQAEATFLLGIEAKHAKLVELNAETAKFNDHLAHQITLQDQLNAKLETQKQLRQAEAEAAAKSAAAQDKAEIAKINADTTLSPAEKAARIANIGLGADARGGAAQHAADQGVITELITRFGSAQLATRPENLPAMVDAAAAANKDQLGSIARAKADLPGLEKELDEAKKKQITAAEEVAKYQRMGITAENDPFGRFAEASKLAEDAGAEAAKAEEAVKKTRTLSEQTDTTSAPLERLRAALEENNKAVLELPEKIATAIKVQAIHDKGNTGAQASDATAALMDFLRGNSDASIGGNISIGFMQKVFEMQQQSLKWNALSPDQQQAARQAIFEGHVPDVQPLTDSQKQVAAEFSKLINNQINHNSELYRFISVLMTHVGDSAKMLADFHRQLDYIRRTQATNQHQFGAGS